MLKQFSYILLALLVISGCGTAPFNTPITVINAPYVVQPIGPPPTDSLLVVACDTSKPLPPKPDTSNPFYACGFWLIYADTLVAVKMADFQSPAYGKSDGLIWLTGGQRFIFQQMSGRDWGYQIATFFFDGRAVTSLFPAMHAVGGTTVSPDGRYFVAKMCQGGNIELGSTYLVYDAQAGVMIGVMEDGIAAMNGCGSYAPNVSHRDNFVFPLADGTDWILSSITQTWNPDYPQLVIRRCWKDGRCVPQNWGGSPPQSISTRFKTSTFGNAVTIYEVASKQTTTYLIPSMKVLDTAWSPATR